MSNEAIPSLADLFNIPSELDWKGKKYKLSKPTKFQQARFARYLEDRAMDTIVRNGTLNSSERKEAISDTASQAAAGRFDWGGRTATEALASPTGMAKIVEILLANTPDSLTELECQEMIDDNFDRIAAIIMERIEADPKAKALIGNILNPISVPLLSPSSTRRSAKRKRKSRR